MLHTMHDATGVVLRVDYKVKLFCLFCFYHYMVNKDYHKSMKCDVLFSQGSVRTIFGLDGHFFIRKNNSSSLQQCKNYKHRSRFTEVMITNVLPPYLWFAVFFVSSILSPVFSCRVFSSRGICIFISCNFMSCIFMPRDFDGPSFARPAFSAALSVPTVNHVSAVHRHFHNLATSFFKDLMLLTQEEGFRLLACYL